MPPFQRVPELAVIIPTLNEAENIGPLVERLSSVLAGTDWEAVFVDDDSPDGTAALARAIAQRDPRIRVIQRIGRGGLASACVEGMLATSAPYLAVMDADFQHDEALLPRMLACARAGGADIVVACRAPSADASAPLSPARRALSRAGAAVSRLVCRYPVSDPMSGFFLLRRDFFHVVARRLSGTGFKILVDILASASRPPRIAEIPYTFRPRLRGASKLDVNVGFEYALLVAEKALGDVLPLRFSLFALVGATGVVLNVAELWFLMGIARMGFVAAQSVAAVSAMAANFFLNNAFTYRDLRLRGWAMLAGLASFCAACSVGALVNIVLAKFCYEHGLPWYLAAVAGLAVGSIWNYSVTSVVTWRRLRRRGPLAGAPVMAQSTLHGAAEEPNSI